MVMPSCPICRKLFAKDHIINIYPGDSRIECPICMVPDDHQLVILRDCGHCFHRDCIDLMLTHTSKPEARPRDVLDDVDGLIDEINVTLGPRDQRDQDIRRMLRDGVEFLRRTPEEPRTLPRSLLVVPVNHDDQPTEVSEILERSLTVRRSQPTEAEVERHLQHINEVQAKQRRVQSQPLRKVPGIFPPTRIGGPRLQST